MHLGRFGDWHGRGLGDPTGRKLKSECGDSIEDLKANIGMLNTGNVRDITYYTMVPYECI